MRAGGCGRCDQEEITKRLGLVDYCGAIASRTIGGQEINSKSIDQGHRCGCEEARINSRACKSGIVMAGGVN